ncbi:MAG: tetratricopeptide repeat protein [Candidatus Omnitrophica bacterium]|nr:tetratricopeptide repeat protein [Candidatus Omnitrophota bacterium]
MKKILRHFIPTIIAFFCAFIFFLGYNHYLLDSSLANLKISLRDLETARSLTDVKRITGILDDSFLDELAKGDFDLAFAVKLELSQQIVEQELKAQKQTKEYAVKLSSAADIDFSAVITEKISKSSQINDIKHFITQAINKKIASRPALVNLLDNISIKLFPGKREVNEASLKSQIVKIEKGISKYKGEELQDRYVEIGKLYLLLKDWVSAEKYFNRSIEVNSKNIKAVKTEFFLGVLYKCKKDFVKAAQTFGKIKEQLPKEWKLFAYYQEADCLYKSGETNKAIALFEDLFRLDPSLEIPQLSQFRAGYAYLYDLQNPQKANETFNVLKKDVPKIELTSFIENKIDPDMAWQYCKVGFGLLEIGYKQSLDDKYKEALDKFDEALALYPKHSTSYVGKALAFCFLKNPEEAITEGAKAIALNPDDYEAIANLGFIYFNLGMKDEAIEQYKKAVDVYHFSYIYNYNLATLYLLGKKYKLAEEYFVKTIRIKPDYAYAYNNLGYVLWAQGRYNEAKSNFIKAIALKNDYRDAHYNLAVAYFSLGDYEYARKEFMNVELLQPKFRQSNWYLRQIELKLGYKAQ